MILVLVAHMPDETIFGILRAANTWFVVMIILPEVGALTFTGTTFSAS